MKCAKTRQTVPLLILSVCVSGVVTHFIARHVRTIRCRSFTLCTITMHTQKCSWLNNIFLLHILLIIRLMHCTCCMSFINTHKPTTANLFSRLLFFCVVFFLSLFHIVRYFSATHTAIFIIYFRVELSPSRHIDAKGRERETLVILFIASISCSYLFLV